MSRRKPTAFHVKRKPQWRQEELVYPRRKFVLLTKDEKETISTAMLRFWAATDELVAATDHGEFAADWQAIHAALGDLRVELAYVQSAIMQAQRGGHYRDTLAP